MLENSAAVHANIDSLTNVTDQIRLKNMLLQQIIIDTMVHIFPEFYPNFFTPQQVTEMHDYLNSVQKNQHPINLDLPFIANSKY